MNISYRAYPVLAFLKDVELSKTVILNNSVKIGLYRDIIFNAWNDNNLKFSENIELLSSNFQDAMLLSQDKLIPILDDVENLAENMYQLNGTMFIKDFTVAYVYVESHLCYFIFQKDILIYFCLRNKDSHYLLGNDNDDFSLFYHLESYLQLYLVFKKYAEIEERIIKAKERLKLNDQKCINNTLLNLKIIDSSWFTSIIKSEEFKVRGHFRLQQYKNEKKLIWINDFKKSGYTRTAKKI